MFYKTTSFKTLFFLLLKIRSFTVKSVFFPVHHQCELHGENFYITLVNIVHSYNKNVSWHYLVVILGKTVGGGAFPPLYPIFDLLAHNSSFFLTILTFLELWDMNSELQDINPQFWKKEMLSHNCMFITCENSEFTSRDSDFFLRIVRQVTVTFFYFMSEMAFYTTVNSDSKDSFAITEINYILFYIKNIFRNILENYCFHGSVHLHT